jgi:gliding motility-associated-like protein
VGEWSGPPEVTFSDINDPNAIATCTSPGGSMTLTWTDFNGFQCSASDEVTIQFSDSLSVLAVPEDTRCYNECSGSVVAIASGGTAPGGSYAFDWGDNGVAGLVPSVRDSLCTGTFLVTVTDNFGCTDSTVFSIGQPAAQEIFLTQAPPLCADSCNGEIVITSPGAVEYSFDGGDSYQSINKANVCAGEHVVIARNADGCEIEETVVLNDPLPYQANFNINPNPTTTRNTRITFQDVSQPGPVFSSEYTFGSDPVLGYGDSRISIFTFPKDTAGTYPITLISTNQNGCIDTLTQFLTIDPELQWYVPNSFTPNEDGINDIWKPIGDTHDLNDFRLSIFNRWGEQMFFTTDYSKGWNGTNSGNGYYVEAGVYTYLIKFSSRTTEEKYEITGHITVIR